MSGRHGALGAAAPTIRAVSDDRAPAIRVISGRPTPSELAAVTAVLASLEAERAAETAARRPSPAVSAWEQTRRALRTPIITGPGQWARHPG